MCSVIKYSIKDRFILKLEEQFGLKNFIFATPFIKVTTNGFAFLAQLVEQFIRNE